MNHTRQTKEQTSAKTLASLWEFYLRSHCNAARKMNELQKTSYMDAPKKDASPYTVPF